MRKCLPAIAMITMIVFNYGCKTASKEAVEIKFQLPVGSKYEYAMNMKMKMNEKVMDKDIDVDNDMGFVYTLEVGHDSAGWKTVSSTIDKFNMDINSMGKKIHFGTENNADTTGPMAIASKMFSAMKGAKFSFTLNDNGSIGEVSGVNDMFSKMVEGLPNAAQLLQQMRGSINEETFKENMQRAFEVYPGKPVKPGDSWSKIMTQQSQGLKLKFKTTYTLESVTGNDALIKLDSKISSAESSSINGATADVTGTSAGEVHYDLATGMTTTGNQDIKMNMKIGAQGMEIPANMDMKIDINGHKL
jgi:hypothetical protein